MDVIATTAFGVDAGCQASPEDNVFIKKATKLRKPGFRVYALFFLYSAVPGFEKLAKWLNIPMSPPKVTDFFASAVRDAIEHRRQNEGRNDFLQLMLNSHKLEVDKAEEDPDTVLEFDKTKRRGMTEDEIISNALLFFLAGYDTTRTALSFLSYNLATNPECQKSLIEEIDTVLQGQNKIYCCRVRLFDRFLPENRPENFNYVFLGFGAGPRNCIGLRLAHMQSKMAIVGILQKYRFKTLPETKIPLELEKSTLKPKDGVMLGVEKR